MIWEVAEVARLLLAAVFVVAAVGKLLDLTGARQALRDFGVSGRVALLAGSLLPVVELVVGGALIDPVCVRWAALAALVMLVLFAAGIANALSRGLEPECHCFGRIHSAKAGRGTLSRNLLLALVAGLVAAVGPGPSVGDRLDVIPASSAGWVGLGVAMSVVSALAIAVRHRTVLHASGSALSEATVFGTGSVAVGARAPEFELDGDTDGGARTLTALRARGHPVLVVFSSPTCGPCQALAPELSRWRREHRDRLTLAIVEGDAATSLRYGVTGTPTGVLVDPSGRVASRLALGGASIAALVGEVSDEDGDVDRAAVVEISGRSVVSRRQVVARAGMALSALMLGRPLPAVARQRRPKRCRHVRCGPRCCPPGEVCLETGRGRFKRRVCGCPKGRTRCRGACISTISDPANCGACGHACPRGEICRQVGRGPSRRSVCSCPPGHARCAGECVRTASDAANCGACGHACAPGEVCSDGQCVAVCPAGQTQCGTGCVNVATDTANCGACGHTCATGQTCVNGVCTGQCQPITCDQTGQCAGTIDDGCGGRIACTSAACRNDQVCSQSFCCTPDDSGYFNYCQDHAGGQFVDNCGEVHNCNGGGGGGG